MVDMRFRRHLAGWALLVLAHELYLSSRLLSWRQADDATTPTTRPRVLLVAASGGAYSDVGDTRRADSELGATLNWSPQGNDTTVMEEEEDEGEEDESPMERALDYLAARLPTIKLDYNLNRDRVFEGHQLDRDVEHYYMERYPANMSLEQLQLMAIKASIRMAPMPVHTSWAYAEPRELAVSSWPVKDSARCARHLELLGRRLERLADADRDRRLHASTDIHFLRYLDTFGRAPSDFLRGNSKWYGSHPGCLDTRLEEAPADSPELHGQPGRRIKFRYCMAAIKSVAWPAEAKRAPTSADESVVVGPGPAIRANGSTGGNHFGPTTTDVELDNFFIRLGVCLPEACDSSAFSESQANARQIERLAKFNLVKPFDGERYFINSVYCPPDDRSPLRQVPLAGKLLVGASLVWLALILAATTVHLNVERLYTKSVTEIRRRRAHSCSSNRSGRDSPGGGQSPGQLPGATRVDTEQDNNNNEFRETDFLRLRHNWIKLSLYLWDSSRSLRWGVDLIDCLSLYSNWLRYTRRLKLAVVQQHEEEKRRELQLCQAQPKLLLIGVQKQGQVVSQHSTPPDHGPGETRKEVASPRRRVDTSSLNALKVLALVWIIAGHCIFYLGSTIANGAILMQYARQVTAFMLANGAIYITELFFVITGCLTTYLAFKYNTFELATGEPEPKRPPPAAATENPEVLKPLMEAANRREKASPGGGTRLESRMFRPTFWLMIIINRYLRILPTYLLVYSYVRLVSLYVGGSGQLWDYAVSPNSVRRRCAQESWWPVLSLTTNFLDIYEHCIVGGWYLSVDMQFMVMAVPVLLVMAHCQRQRRARLGRPQQMRPERRSPPAPSPKQQQQQWPTFSPAAAGADPNPDRKPQGATSAAAASSWATGKQPALGSLELVVAPKTTTTTTTTATTELPEIHNTARGYGVCVSRRRLLAAYSIVLAAAGASALASIVYGILQASVDLSYVIKFVPHTVTALSRNINMYTNAVFRFRTFALGLLVGHLLYLYEFRLIRLPKVLQQHGAKLTSGLLALGFCLMLLPVLYPRGKIILSHDITALLMVLSATGIDLFLCAIIFLVCIGKAPKLALFLLESPFWSLLSQPSLCAFLVHTEVIVVLTSQLNPPPSAQYSLLVLVFSATLIITYLLALALYLAFEMPLGRLLEALMRKWLGDARPLRSDNPAGAKKH